MGKNKKKPKNKPDGGNQAAANNDPENKAEESKIPDAV